GGGLVEDVVAELPKEAAAFGSGEHGVGVYGDRGPGRVRGRVLGRIDAVEDIAEDLPKGAPAFVGGDLRVRDRGTRTTRQRPDEHVAEDQDRGDHDRDREDATA